VVNSRGTVIVLGPDCMVTGWDSPDYLPATASSHWSSYAWKWAGASGSPFDCPVGAVLDETDVLYFVNSNGTLYAITTFSGFPVLEPGFPMQLPDVLPSGAEDDDGAALLYADDVLWVPTATMGAVGVILATGAIVTPASMSGADVTGSARVTVPESGAHTAVFCSAGGHMRAIKADGSKLWESGTAIQFRCALDNAHPLHDPASSRVFVMAGWGTLTTFCLDSTTGKVCAGRWSVAGKTGAPVGILGEVGHVNTPVLSPPIAKYGGQLLLGATGNAYDPTVLYPYGVVFSLLASSGALLDVYAFSAADVGPATSPVLAADARGMGYHTLFVLTEGQGQLYAFDPVALSSGPLYVAQAVPTTDFPFSIGARYLTMTEGGCVVLVYQSSAYTHVAVVVNATEPRVSAEPAAPAAGSSSMSGGQKAGVAFGVILSIGAAGIVGLWAGKRAGYNLGRAGDVATTVVEGGAASAASAARWVAAKASGAARGGGGGGNWSSIGSSSAGGGGRGGEATVSSRLVTGSSGYQGGGASAPSAPGYTDL
jgi:hypothetical protein